MIGKPYSGKLNVRFDEGELEIEHSLLRQFSTLLLKVKLSAISNQQSAHTEQIADCWER